MGERRENFSCAVTILNAGRVNYDQQQQSEGINQDMSFAASSLLTGIKAAFVSAAVSRFDRLRVDDRSARLPLRAPASPSPRALPWGAGRAG